MKGKRSMKSKSIMVSTKKSEDIFKRSERFLPWGSSTCSKRPKLFPEEPGTIARGEGCRVWDADGNVYIDFRNSLGPITLGYRFPAIDEAIREQLENGIIFGHPHPLEGEVAEMICEVIPCAQRARFLKTGGEAMAAAIKIARAHTRRDHIVQIGYNGWLNSVGYGASVLPGTTTKAPPLGVPKAVADLFHVCGWNQLSDVEAVFDQLPNQIAAVCVSCDYPRMALGETFLPALRALTRERDALLIIDEIVTGFRLAIGGAQERFGVIPDLSVFAKGIANGMPISVYAGSADVMSVLDMATVSSTYGGETLSLAAAKAAINAYRNEGVVDHLWRMGERMWGGLNEIFVNQGVDIRLKGAWPCPAFTGDDASGPVMEAFFRRAYANGVSLYNVGYVNFSHGERDVDEALERLAKAVTEI